MCRFVIRVQILALQQAGRDEQAGLQRGDEPGLHPAAARHDQGLPASLILFENDYMCVLDWDICPKYQGNKISKDSFSKS